MANHGPPGTAPGTCIWLDCDPGHDDAMAIMLAGHSPHITLLGVSTVAGNQTLELVTQNAVDVLDACGLQHIDVVAGQRKPLLRPSPILCPEIHGSSGLDGPGGGPHLPRSQRQPVPGKAVNVMFERIQAQFETTGGTRGTHLVCTGALTNAALLLTLYPEVVPMLEAVFVMDKALRVWARRPNLDNVLMGGCMGCGNTGPVMEFNIQTDPEAAHVVFSAGLPRLVMVPLEVTHSVLVTPDVLRRVTAGPAGPTPFRSAVRELLLFFKETYKSVFHMEDPPLHDPCAVAYVVAPQLFKGVELRVDVETQSVLSPGQTVCDVWRQSGKPPNCLVATAVDVAAFWELQLDAIASADRASPLNAYTTLPGDGEGL